MRNLKEDILQFIWQHKLLKPLPLITTSGKEIIVLKPGELNKDSGPDFFNAQIKINDIILAGNIEVHVKTGDWLKHGHQSDTTYDNLILHVVYEDNKELAQNKNNNVEVLEIKNLIPEGVLTNYGTLIESKHSIPCESQLKNVNDLKFTSWLQRMLIERLEHKVKRIEELFENFSGNYSQVFYTIILRNFGFKVNAVPFELLARQLPLNILLKHVDNPLQMEALLLGTAGLLEDQFSDKYILSLQNEFEFLRNKYSITPMRKELFKFSRLRPANFATLRLAQLARLIFLRPELFHSPQNFNTYKKTEAVLSFEMEGYWKHHHMPGGIKTTNGLHLGKDSISNIIINTFAPFFFFYFKKTGIPHFEDVPLELLEKCSFEKNAKTKLFEQKKEVLKSAADSQALINLHDNFCTRRKCLNCAVAASILQSR
ncbi:MAG: DUF2851 family protein [Bacteroidia bacterium]